MHWSLQTPDGKSRVRIVSGLVIGEDEQGQFEISPPDKRAGLVRFDVDARAVYISLVSRDLVLVCREQLLVGGSFRSERPVELHLPNNVFRVVGGDDSDAEPERLELTRRYSLNWLRPVLQAQEDEPADPEDIGLGERDAVPDSTRFTEAFLAEAAAARDRRGTDPDERGPILVGRGDRHSQPAESRRPHSVGPLTAAVIGFAGGITAALLVPALREDPEPPPSTALDAGAPAETAPPQEPSAVAGDSGPVGGSAAADSARSGDPLLSPPPPDPQPADEPAARDALAQRPAEPLPDPRASSTPPIEPIVPPPVERRPVPRPSQDQAPADVAAEAPADPQPADRAPDAALVAELTEIGDAARAVADELTLRRDLLAADLALAQGRLTTPPETSALALYRRALALDPDSGKATQGLQSVRQTLINRTLAQLAGGTLDEARRTLEAAEEAGVDPQLVADLRGEVDYRQQSSDTGTGG